MFTVPYPIDPKSAPRVIGIGDACRVEAPDLTIPERPAFTMSPPPATNDNAPAIAFYRACGLTLAAVHEGAVEIRRLVVERGATTAFVAIGTLYTPFVAPLRPPK